MIRKRKKIKPSRGDITALLITILIIYIGVIAKMKALEKAVAEDPETATRMLVTAWIVIATMFIMIVA